MRRILAGFFAAAMVASAAAPAALAAERGASVELKVNKAKTDDADVSVTINALNLELEDGGGKTIASIEIPIKATVTSNDKGEINQKEVVQALKGKKANVQINGAYYKCELKASGNTGLLLQFGDPIQKLDSARLTLDATLSSGGFDPGTKLFAVGDVREGAGRAGVTADTDGNISVLDALVCTPEGDPIPLAKTAKGVDKILNDDDGIQPDGNKVYFMIREENDSGGRTLFDDDRYYRVRVSKGDNGKYVKSLKVVSKSVNTQNLYSALNGQTVPGTAGRHRFIEVEFNPLYDDEEVKVTFNLRITPTNDAIDLGYAKDGEELRVRDFYVRIKNIERAADNDWKVGINGLLLKPLENDWNEVTWYDEDGDLAYMHFFADSDVDSFYSKLSTKWDHADYASYFNDQDAFIFDFTGSPKLSSTSRADLQIYNPFVDADGKETMDPTTAVIYQVIDGNLYDITESFTYEEGDNGEMAYCCRTRFLGTYIICQKPVKR